MMCELAEKRVNGRSDIRFSTATLIVVALIVAGFLADAALGCGQVYDVDLWLGENQDDADAHNTNTVYEPHYAPVFFWHVHWAAYGPDGNQCFYGETWDVTSNQLLEPGEWSASPSARAESGAAWWYPTYPTSGWKTIKMRVRRTGGDWRWSEGVEIGITEVELEKLSAGNSPDLAPGVICLNAQACYKKAKWKAKKVMPPGTTARVQNWGQMVTFTGIGGSDPSDLFEGETFWATAVGSEPGTYHINIIHNHEIDSLDTDSGSMFRFDHYWTKYDTDGGATGSGSRNEAAGTVSAPKTTDPGYSTSGAYVKWLYHTKVTTLPSGAYSGKVTSKAEVLLYTDGTVTIWTDDYDNTMNAFTVTADYGFVTVSSTTYSGTTRYWTCVAGWRAEIKWDGETGEYSANDKVDYSNVPAPESGFAWKTWNESPDVYMVKSSNTLTYTVDSTEAGFHVRVDAASNAENPAGSTCYSNVPTNNNSIQCVQVYDQDGVFDIVP